METPQHPEETGTTAAAVVAAAGVVSAPVESAVKRIRLYMV
jgi:hypothetical protein